MLAVDIGTSSVRSALVDESARIASATLVRTPTDLTSANDGASEADPSDLAQRVWQCIDGTLERAHGLITAIAGVAVTTFVPNVCGLDDSNTPVTPLYTWADTRGGQEVDLLQASLDWNEVHERTGCPAHTSYLPARLMWVQSSNPDLYSRVSRWVSIGEYIELLLFGHARCSLSVASWTGLLNRRRLTWDEALMGRLGVSQGQLSPLADVTEPISGLRDEFRKRWPALADIPWYPALGDGVAHNYGCGAGESHRIALSLGTSGAVRGVVQGDPLVTAGLWVYRVDSLRSLVGGALSEGGNVLVWLNQLLRPPLASAPGDHNDLDDLGWEAAVQAIAPDSHGLTVLPFVAGERSPGWRPNARAAITGMTLTTTPAKVLRAGIEAVAYRLAEIYCRLPSEITTGRSIVASGGALRFTPWYQIISDVLGCAVEESLEQEASLRGAAIFAWRSLGAWKGCSDPHAAVGKVYEPDERRHRVYSEARERQRALYERLIPLWTEPGPSMLGQ